MEVGVSEAADRLGLSPQRVRALLSAGSIRGRRIGGRWLIDEQELARSAGLSRPMSARMAWALAVFVEGEDPVGLHPEERSRIRRAVHRLRQSDRPAETAASWFRRFADRYEYSIAVADIPDLAADDRFVPSGVSDPRSRMSAASEIEGYVRYDNLTSIVEEYLLVRRGPHSTSAPNARLRVPLTTGWDVTRPAPGLLVAVDLAVGRGGRERGEADMIIARLLGTS